jgi:hypothetical protein
MNWQGGKNRYASNNIHFSDANDGIAFTMTAGSPLKKGKNINKK